MPAPLVAMPFFVIQETEFRIGRSLIARYLPGMTYRLTVKNKEFVAQMVEDGRAQYGQPSADAASLATQVSGRISTKPKKS